MGKMTWEELDEARRAWREAEAMQASGAKRAEAEERASRMMNVAFFKAFPPGRKLEEPSCPDVIVSDEIFDMTGERYRHRPAVSEATSEWLHKPGARLDDLVRAVAERIGLSAHQHLALLVKLNERWPHLAA